MRLTFCISILAVVLATGAVLAQEVLDQHKDVGDSVTADSASPFAVETGQTFTVGVAGTLSRIELQINKLFGIGGGATLTVYDTVAGVPQTSRGTSFLPESSIPVGTYAYQSFDLSASAISVDVGDVMAVTITSSGAGFGLRSTFTLDTYADGHSIWCCSPAQPGIWQSYTPSHDNGFKTYVIPSDIALPGDFNNDGDVDAADYVVWRRHLNEPSEDVLNGNGDNSNGVDVGDYHLWQQNFGASGGAGHISFVAAPEPTTIIPLTVPLIVGLANSPRRSRRHSHGGAVHQSPIPSPHFKCDNPR
jgi:hypothetical protein